MRQHQFYFIVAEDFLNLNDYYVLLYSQVKRESIVKSGLKLRKRAFYSVYFCVSNPNFQEG